MPISSISIPPGYLQSNFPSRVWQTYPSQGKSSQPKSRHRVMFHSCWAMNHPSASANAGHPVSYHQTPESTPITENIGNIRSGQALQQPTRPRSTAPSSRAAPPTSRARLTVQEAVQLPSGFLGQLRYAVVQQVQAHFRRCKPSQPLCSVEIGLSGSCLRTATCSSPSSMAALIRAEL